MRSKFSTLLLLLATTLSAPAWAQPEEAEAAPNAAAYHPLDPFVVNLQADGRRMHFMQVSVQVMTRDEKVSSAIKKNLPPVRDALLMLLSHQSKETMGRVEGRENVREEAQGTIQEVLLEVAGLEKGVEAVYFTDFVVQ